MAASENRNPAVLEALLAAGADINARANGRTPLHEAARRNAAMFTVLLKLGADPTALDGDGRTPFHYARENKALQGLESVRRSGDPRRQR